MRIEHEILPLHTRHPFHIARAAAPPQRRSVWLRVIDDDGAEGWGEAAANAYYGETADTVIALLPLYEQVLDRAIGEWREGPARVAVGGVPDPATRGAPGGSSVSARSGSLESSLLLPVQALEQQLELAAGRNPAARVALSAALHDLQGRRLGAAVWQMWGLDPAASPLSSFTLGIDSEEVLYRKLEEATSYPILKLKVGSPGDRAMLELVRRHAPDKRIRVDANTGWSVKQALALLPLMEELDVELIEQPLKADDLDGLRLLRDHSRIPIVADESCRVAADVPALAGAVDGVNIKLEKCGSLTEALRIIHAARAHHLGVMIGCMTCTSLGIAAAMQLAPLADWVDLDGAALLAHDPFEGPYLAEDGRMVLLNRPGLGVTRRTQTA